MQNINRKSKIIETYCLEMIDLVSIVLAYSFALFLRFKSMEAISFMQIHYYVGVFILLVSLLYNIFSDWNRGFFERGKGVELIAVVKYNVVLAMAIGGIVFVMKLGWSFSRLVFGYFAICNIVITYLLHQLFKYYMLHEYRKSNSSDKVMVVTEMRYAHELIKNLLEGASWNYDITAVALLDEDSSKGKAKEIAGIPVVANRKNLFEVARQMPLDEVFLYLPHTDIGLVKSTIIDFETMGVICHYNVEIPELELEGKTAGRFAGYAVMTFSLQYMDYRRMLLKRGMDILGGLVGLLLTAVLTPFIALAIKVESRGPVFFSQVRIGKNGRRFRLWKFRSMYIDAEERKKELEQQNEADGFMFKMENDPRITKVGKVIRKLSLDELPQFLNVLAGDMSLVGTRPPTVDEFEKYNIQYRRRLSITPGLTGMWQVSGRSDITKFDEVVELDLKYIENWSLWLDIKILCQTVGVVLFGRGAK